MEHYLWNTVRGAVGSAKAITWDECHKIYVLMDDEQVEKMKGYGYAPIIPVTHTERAIAILKQWFDGGCSLRFIQSIRTVEDNPSEGFTSLIGQFDLEDDEEGN